MAAAQTSQRDFKTGDSISEQIRSKDRSSIRQSEICGKGESNKKSTSYLLAQHLIFAVAFALPIEIARPQRFKEDDGNIRRDLGRNNLNETASGLV